LGFIPVGFFLSLWLRTPFSRSRHFLVCLLSAFAVSLLIELLQVYLPTRSSQWMDVICNTLGASAGIFLYGRLLKNELLE
jgi:glycopeptide antibiotics resistance protein